MMSNVDEQVKEIKRSFRLVMNGVTAQSMRDKGADYHINWGAPLPELKKMAANITPDIHLAIALWKENVRECRILALMLMPPEEMSQELTDLWMEQTTTVELAELGAHCLYAKTAYAAEKAFCWIASERMLCQVAGFNVVARLMAQGIAPNEKGINELIDQALVALQGENLSVRKAAMAAIVRLAELGSDYQRIAKSALKTIDADFL